MFRMMITFSLHCALASCSTVYCNRSCLWVGVWVGLLPQELKTACIDPRQTGFVGKGSDHLQLIRFWPSHAPEKGVCGGAKIFGSALLQPAHNVCVSSEHFSLHCALSLAAQCIFIGPVCVFATGGWALFVCGSVTTINQNCVHRSSRYWVCR